MDLNKHANKLFDRLYGQPREDLDNREMKVITEWLSELLGAERRVGFDEGNKDWYQKGYRRGLEEAAQIVLHAELGPISFIQKMREELAARIRAKAREGK